jgi:hypothetical protein
MLRMESSSVRNGWQGLQIDLSSVFIPGLSLAVYFT